MEFEAPHSPFRALKRAVAFFETKVNNSNIKEQPLSRKDDQELEMGVKTLFGEIFWMKVSARRAKDKKRSKIFVKGRPGIWHMFLSTIVLLMSGPFLYMAIDSGSPFTYIAAVVFALIGIASLILPFIRLRKTKKDFKEALLSTEEIQTKEEKSDKRVMTRLQIE